MILRTGCSHAPKELPPHATGSIILPAPTASKHAGTTQRPVQTASPEPLGRTGRMLTFSASPIAAAVVTSDDPP